MEASVQDIKALRDRTSAGIMDCKRALEQSNGNIDKAEEILKDQGVASAAKKSSRDTNEGLIECYVHSGGRIGAIVEVNCETDFVARTDEFKQLAHDLAMQIAAMSPTHVDSEDSDDDDIPEESFLMQQPFIKDQTKSIRDLVNEAVGKLGENIRVRKFARFSLGE